ncbi:MAG: hypothetical protein JNL21_18685 [Myxococcales bacterium]|nr:hypothetical protein [Myxococcales bacterium]
MAREDAERALNLETVPPVHALRGVRSIALGFGVTCAVMDDRTVRCWGRNDQGQRGLPNGEPATTPVPVPGLTDVSAVDVSHGFGCALRRDGSVLCWGEGLGSGSKRFAAVPNLTDVRQIAVSTYRMLALDKGAALWSFRPVSSNAANAPIRNASLADAVQVDDNWDHTCALRVDGTVWCWGTVGHVRSGPDQFTTRSSDVPVRVEGLKNVVEVALGTHHACARRRDGGVACWGIGVPEALGQTDGAALNKATDVPGVENAVQVASGGGSFSCALLRDKTVVCWGRNTNGELGDGTQRSIRGSARVAGLSDVRAVACGLEHACALNEDGTVRCWGSNRLGELGNGVTSPASLVPVYVVTERAGAAPSVAR